MCTSVSYTRMSLYVNARGKSDRTSLADESIARQLKRKCLKPKWMRRMRRTRRTRRTWNMRRIRRAGSNLGHDVVGLEIALDGSCGHLGHVVNSWMLL